MVGFYASEEEAAAMMKAASDRDMTLADWLRSLIPSDQQVKHTPTAKTGAKPNK